MKANERALLTACIDTGISFGWNRAHKHTDEPNEHRIQEEIENAIWYEIDQYFVFDSERDLCDEVVEGFDHLEKEREWVGLTKEELQDLCVKSYATDSAGETHFNRGYFADAIEAKLKEKNT